MKAFSTKHDPLREDARAWLESKTQGSQATFLSDLADADQVAASCEVVVATEPAFEDEHIELAARLLPPRGRFVAIVRIGYGTIVPHLHRRFELIEVVPLDGALGLVALKRDAALGDGHTAPLPAELVENLERAYEAQLHHSKRAAAATEHELARRLRKAEAELRKRTVQLLETAQNHGEGDHEKLRLKEQLRRAEARSEQVKQTLSYRLGYELIHSTKSLRKLASLPSSLWDVNQEAVRRRNGKPLLKFLDKYWPGSHRPGGPGQFQGPSIVSKSRSPAANKSRLDPRAAAQHFDLPTSLGTLASGKDLAELRLACIMDEFTMSSFAPECKTSLLSPDQWQEELEAFQPDLLFVESAWRGKDGEWSGKIGHISVELRGILQFCQEKRIPTVFWCKEDPVHFSTFINTAALFDLVFTTDIDCIHRYKQTLGHDRIYLLPFACQPAAQNPIEKYERKDAACFAGAYYLGYPERQRDFLRMVVKLLEHRPVEIFDRNFGKDDPRYQFPETYRPLIQGTLAFSEIDRAYKGYDYAININSIKYSQSMFARRVFEVLASNTVTVSNFSRGIQLLFGGLVIATDDANTLDAQLADLASNNVLEKRFRLCGLRKVLQEHTYQDRLAYIVSKVFETRPPELLPKIAVLAAAETEAQVETIIAACQRQSLRPSQILLIAPQALANALSGSSEVTLLAREARGSEAIAAVAQGADFVACFVPEDYYGSTYLLDLALTTRYIASPAIGKLAHYHWTDGIGPILKNDGAQYRPALALSARSAMATPGCYAQTTVEQIATASRTLEIRSEEAFCIDEFSYCLGGAPHATRSEIAGIEGLVPDLNVGFPLARLLEEAENILPLAPADGEMRAIETSGLQQMFPAGDNKCLSIIHAHDGLIVDSVLEPRTSQYLYSEDLRPVREFGFDTTARFFLDVSAGLTVQVVLIFFDSDRKRIGHTINRSLTNHAVEVPLNAAYVRFGLHASGPGRVTVRRLILGVSLDQDPVRIFGRSKTLVLTNQYPSCDELYRNAFVHRRVLKYRERGETVDVFRLTQDQSLSYHDFEGVAVLTGGDETLRRVLETNHYGRVLVHFLNETMWTAVKPHLGQMKLIVWLHGVEIQSWQRRHHSRSDQRAVLAAREASERRSVFWRSVLSEPHPNLRVVFVSQYLADQVQEDLGLTLPGEQISIIHNLIDGELFSYAPKPAEQRKRILTIRPFTSSQYANDLAVQAIVALSESDFFEELDFLIIGRGSLFEETLKPLRAFPNVRIEERFLTQREMAGLYADYGVCLIPTRGDTQGVSRDEAMACGLVPITNNVTAIPEFVDGSCSLLAPAEDATGLATAIERLYYDPELFLRLSANAAARVRKQSSAEQTIDRELALFAAGANSARDAYPEKSDDTSS